MYTMADKRTRTKNFSTYEKSILIELVKQHSIVITKAKDPKTNHEKEASWEQILTSFNGDAHVSERDVEQLKSCLVNLTTKAKKENALRKRSLLKTGGGPGEGSGVSQTSEELMQLMPQVFSKFERPRF